MIASTSNSKTTSNNKAKPDYLSLIKTGNSEGLLTIYEKFFPRILRMITKYGGTVEDGEDVFQEALIIIYEKVNKPNFKLTSSFYTLLYGICKNLWGSKLQRKYRTDLPILNEDAFEDSMEIEKALMQKELENIFWSNFNTLCQGCKQVLKMAFNGESMETIRQEMGYGSVNYTRKRKFKCKEKLIKKIKQDTRFKELMLLKEEGVGSVLEMYA